MPQNSTRIELAILNLVRAIEEEYPNCAYVEHLKRIPEHFKDHVPANPKIKAAVSVWSRFQLRWKRTLLFFLWLGLSLFNQSPRKVRDFSLGLYAFSAWTCLIKNKTWPSIYVSRASDSGRNLWNLRELEKAIRQYRLFLERSFMAQSISKVDWIRWRSIPRSDSDIRPAEIL